MSWWVHKLNESTTCRASKFKNRKKTWLIAQFAINEDFSYDKVVDAGKGVDSEADSVTFSYFSRANKIFCAQPSENSPTFKHNFKRKNSLSDNEYLQIQAIKCK